MSATADQKIRSIKLAVWILAGLVVTGTLVFYVIGRPRHSLFDAMWMTVQILTTVGDTGYERTRPEQVWSMLLMGVGVLAVFYLGINLVAFVVDGELRQLLGRRQLESRIKKMREHFIVCGFGRMGRALAEALNKKGAKFVVIDVNEKAMFDAAELGYLHLHGDAMSDEILEAAQIKDARGLASCLPEDSNNVFAALTARDLNHDLHIVAKANYEEAHAKLRRAGAVGKPLRELALPKKTSLMVVAVVHEDGSRSFNPSPDTDLRTGDELIVIGPEGGVTKMVEHFGEQ